MDSSAIPLHAPEEERVALPMPGGHNPLPEFQRLSQQPAVNTTLAPAPIPHLVVNDDRAVVQLLTTLLDRAGLTTYEAARQLGITDEGLRQYLRGRRTRPSLQWFIRFVQLCGARLAVEFPLEHVVRRVYAPPTQVKD